MNEIKEWTAILSITVVISALIEFLIPPGKMEKILNMVLGTFAVCSFIIPIPSLKNNLNISLKNTLNSQELKKQQHMEEKIKSQTSDLTRKNIEAIIRRYLNNIGIIPQKIEVLMDIGKDNCIIMNKCKIYISENSKISKDTIKKSLENDLNIQSEIIVV